MYSKPLVALFAIASLLGILLLPARGRQSPGKVSTSTGNPVLQSLQQNAMLGPSVVTTPSGSWQVLASNQGSTLETWYLTELT